MSEVPRELSLKESLTVLSNHIPSALIILNLSIESFMDTTYGNKEEGSCNTYGELAARSVAFVVLCVIGLFILDYPRNGPHDNPNQPQQGSHNNSNLPQLDVEMPPGGDVPQGPKGDIVPQNPGANNKTQNTGAKNGNPSDFDKAIYVLLKVVSIPIWLICTSEEYLICFLSGGSILNEVKLKAVRIIVGIVLLAWSAFITLASSKIHRVSAFTCNLCQ